MNGGPAEAARGPIRSSGRMCRRGGDRRPVLAVREKPRRNFFHSGKSFVFEDRKIVKSQGNGKGEKRPVMRGRSFSLSLSSLCVRADGTVVLRALVVVARRSECRLDVRDGSMCTNMRM